MIARYAQPDLEKIWSDEYRFSLFLQIECAFLEAWATTKTNPHPLCPSLPALTTNQIATIKAAKILPQRIAELEQSTHHDFIAFCTSITEQLPAELGKYLHWGATSSDVLDTALNLQLKASLSLILPALGQVLRDLWAKAEKYASLLGIGRSHGMQAEPMIYGQKFLSHYAEFYRRYLDLKHFQENELRMQYSGAVGSYTITSPEVEQQAAQLLGLKAEEVSSQVLPRDRIAKLMAMTALLASSIERLATEIRHLSRSEVQEVSEGFAKGQKGSSVMPHKKNPVLSENLCGIARLLRSHFNIALENIVLWHERDISHSSTERVYLPDHFSLLLFALRRTHQLLTNLVVNEAKIEENVKRQDRYLSALYLHYILATTKLSREAAYTAVQAASFSNTDLKTALQKQLTAIAPDLGQTLPDMDFVTLQAWYTQQFKAVRAKCAQAYPITALNL